GRHAPPQPPLRQSRGYRRPRPARAAARHPLKGKPSSSVSQAQRRRRVAFTPRLAYEHTSGFPLHLTYLKPEAARSLFPRLIDRNQKRSIHHFPRKPCSPGCAAARALPAHAERHVGQRQFHGGTPPPAAELSARAVSDRPKKGRNQNSAGR